MSWMAIYLGLTSPPGSSDLPESRRAALCSLFGLASDGVYMCPACYQPGGSLLHCHSTLTGTKPAVYFCCTVPGVASARRYLASCPVKPGLSSPAAFRHCGSDHLSYSNYVPYSTTYFLKCESCSYTRKQLPPINSLTMEFCGIISLLTPCT